MYKDKTITAVFRELECTKCNTGVYRYQCWINSTKVSDNNYGMKCTQCGDVYRAAYPHPVIVYQGQTFRLVEPRRMDELGLPEKGGG